MIPPFASVEEFEPSGVLPDSLDSSLIWSDSPDTSPSILTSLDFESVLEPTLEPCYSMSGVDGYLSMTSDAAVDDSLSFLTSAFDCSWNSDPNPKRCRLDGDLDSSVLSPSLAESSSPLLLATDDAQAPFWFQDTLPTASDTPTTRKRPRDEDLTGAPVSAPFSDVMASQQNMYCDMVQQMMHAQFSPQSSPVVDWTKEWQVQMQNVMNAQLSVIKQFQEQLSRSMAPQSIFIDDDDDDCRKPLVVPFTQKSLQCKFCGTKTVFAEDRVCHQASYVNELCNNTYTKHDDW
ncbi:MAG: uncharacterized protein KVP18_003326 [Porospora cf. gigantea A]|uniref:uncharacterized protein n=1 Tax=Porospora cf. gigantea A TaxID=2853593 RepID=UPI0035598678|nr:MAG: hypothetical protein KVP18_003326 [Porospora cf. gigantea A]